MEKEQIQQRISFIMDNETTFVLNDYIQFCLTEFMKRCTAEPAWVRERYADLVAVTDEKLAEKLRVHSSQSVGTPSDVVEETEPVKEEQVVQEIPAKISKPDTPDGSVFVSEVRNTMSYCPKCRTKTPTKDCKKYYRQLPIGKRYFTIGHCNVCDTKVGSLVKA